VKPEVVANWASVVAALVAATALVINAVALWFNARQFRLNAIQAQADFWLKLEDMLTPYNDVEEKLRPGGAWTGQGKPDKREEWVRLEDYLGTFERTKVLLDLNLVDRLMYKTAFGYRLHNIVANQAIVEEKFRKRAAGWATFLQLLKELDIRIPEDHHRGGGFTKAAES
jgi:hypothetical protein